jgi:hypothetical protein
VAASVGVRVSVEVGVAGRLPLTMTTAKAMMAMTATRITPPMASHVVGPPSPKTVLLPATESPRTSVVTFLSPATTSPPTLTSPPTFTSRAG